MDEGGTLFRGVDRALVLSSFASKLRRAGIRVSVQGIERATAGLATVGPPSARDLYWICRLSFVSDREQLDRFDQVFDAVFDRTSSRNEQRSTIRGATDAVSTGDRHQRVKPPKPDAADIGGAGLPWATRPSIVPDDDEGGDDESDLVIPDLVASSTARIGDRAFEELDEEELLEAGRLLEEAISTWPQRSSRRRRVATTGSHPELRLALRKALRSGGEPFVLPRSRPTERLRPVALLLDVSGSMESYARAYLHVARALVSGGQTEAFAFATTVTRLTPSLRLRSPADAIEQATQEVGDRFGGTRIASSLATLLRHRAWPSTLRGSVVIIVSDGWDTDRPEDLARSMARLARLAHRVIWVNPRLAADDFEPTVGGMAAAIDHCDFFLPGHSVSAMSDVLAALRA